MAPRTSKGETLFLQKVPFSCYNFRNHWLITIQIRSAGEGTQKTSRTFLLCYRGWWSRMQIEEAFCVFPIYLQAFGPQGREPVSCGWDGGRALCCAEAAKLMEKNLPGVSASPVSAGSEDREGRRKDPQRPACALFYSSQLGF